MVATTLRMSACLLAHGDVQRACVAHIDVFLGFACQAVSLRSFRENPEKSVPTNVERRPFTRVANFWGSTAFSKGSGQTQTRASSVVLGSHLLSIPRRRSCIADDNLFVVFDGCHILTYATQHNFCICSFYVLPRDWVGIFGLGARWYVGSRGEERRRFIRLGGVAGQVAFSCATIKAVLNEMSSPRWFGHSEGP